jgi:hypothetical protein
MDRAYSDFAWLYGIHQTGAFFVSRAKRGMADCTPRQTTEATAGYPEHLRRIWFHDEGGKDAGVLDEQYRLATVDDRGALTRAAGKSSLF